MIVNVPKLVGILVAMGIVASLIALERVPSDAGLGLLGILVGYLAGNGNAARNGTVAGPVIAPKSGAGETDHP